MNDNLTISTFEFFQMFPDAESARLYFEQRRWDGHVVCPHCGSDQISARTGKRLGYYRCGSCKEEFTVRTKTIFERSHVPLNKWLLAMYLVVTARKGISSLQLSKEISVTQKTAPSSLPVPNPRHVAHPRTGTPYPPCRSGEVPAGSSWSSAEPRVRLGCG